MNNLDRSREFWNGNGDQSDIFELADLLDEAEQRGAEHMREAAAKLCHHLRHGRWDDNGHSALAGAAEKIRALPTRGEP